MWYQGIGLETAGQGKDWALQDDGVRDVKDILQLLIAKDPFWNLAKGKFKTEKTYYLRRCGWYRLPNIWFFGRLEAMDKDPPVHKALNTVNTRYLAGLLNVEVFL